jgi:uncharacterized alkaline shock family protein YloU
VQIFKNEFGKITVTKKALLSFISYILAETYGIVDVAPVTLYKYLFGHNLEKGNDIVEKYSKLKKIRLSLIVPYGLKIDTVTNNLIEILRTRLKNQLGIIPEAIEINVKDVYMEDDNG